MNIHHQQFSFGDSYDGTRDDLIAAGVCKAHWFPNTPTFDRRGRQKRSFTICEGEREVRLSDRNYRGRWSVTIHISEAERARREAEREAEVDRRAAIELHAQSAEKGTENWTMLERLTERELKFLCMYRQCTELGREHLDVLAMHVVLRGHQQQMPAPTGSPGRRRLPANVIAFPSPRIK